MKDVSKQIDHNSCRFMERLRLHTRARNLAYDTENIYAQWVLRSIRLQTY